MGNIHNTPLMLTAWLSSLFLFVALTAVGGMARAQSIATSLPPEKILDDEHIPVKYRPVVFAEACYREQAQYNPAAFEAALDPLVNRLGWFAREPEYLDVLIAKSRDWPPSIRVRLFTRLARAMDANKLVSDRKRLRSLLRDELMKVVAVDFVKNHPDVALPKDLAGFAQDADAERVFNPWLFSSYAEALLEGEPDEQSRYDMFDLIHEICRVTPKGPELQEVLFGTGVGKDRNGFLYTIRPFESSAAGPPRARINDKADSTRNAGDIRGLETAVGQVAATLKLLAGQMSTLEASVKELQDFRLQTDAWRKWVDQRIDEHDKIISDAFGNREQ